MTLVVLPGYQRLNARQRDCLLTLHERGEISSPVNVHTSRYLKSARARDADHREFTLNPDGSHTWQASKA